MANTPGTTGTSERTNSIQSVLSTGIQHEVARTQTFGQFPYVPEDGAIPSGGAKAGQTVIMRFQQRMQLTPNTINERADITPERVTDNQVSVSINEYGNAVQDTMLATIITKGDLREELIHAIGENQTATLDRLAGRNYYEGQNLVFRANGVSARSGLDSTNDILSASGVGMSFLTRATAALRASRAPGFEMDGNGQSNYMSVIHTALAQDLPETSGYLAALQYQSGRDELFNGELGNIRGLRFVESAQGKVYPGAGATAQAATTISASVSAGATTCVVADATGIAVGDVITLGTVEPGTSSTESEATSTYAGLESVLVTGVSGTTLTIAGLGYSSGNIATPGFRYDHASGTTVTEAALVAALPVFGPRSVMKAYAAEVGEFGEARITGPFDTLGRFHNFGWYAVMGWAKTNGLWTARLEVATKFPHLVVNE